MTREAPLLTVRDLLLPGEPLDPAEVLAGQGRLHNPVTWAVSLRPYPPAFPRLRGGELALVAAEYLARLDPPTTLADVVRQLLSRGAAGMAVRGEVDHAAVEAAEAGGLPLLLLHPEAPLHDIEQAIMRECALYQARREMQPAVEGDVWVEDLLLGRFATAADAQSSARRQGYSPATHYTVAYVAPAGEDASGLGSSGMGRVALALESRFKPLGKAAAPIVRLWDSGLALLLPRSYDEERL